MKWRITKYVYVVRLRDSLTICSAYEIYSPDNFFLFSFQICFHCMKTKFGLFYRGQCCEMCKQTFCTKCHTKVSTLFIHRGFDRFYIYLYVFFVHLAILYMPTGQVYRNGTFFGEKFMIRNVICTFYIGNMYILKYEKYR